MARAIEIFASINFIVMGLSHILQPRAWQEFFGFLHERGVPGSFFNAFLSVGMGSLIVAFHNVWGGLPTLLTLYGWLSLVKGGLFLLVPSIGLRSLERGLAMETRGWIVPGVLLLALAAVTLFAGLEAGAS